MSALVQIAREMEVCVIDRRAARDRRHVVAGREAGMPKQSISRRRHGVGQQKRNQPHNEVYQPGMSDGNPGRYINDTHWTGRRGIESAWTAASRSERVEIAADLARRVIGF